MAAKHPPPGMRVESQKTIFRSMSLRSLTGYYTKGTTRMKFLIALAVAGMALGAAPTAQAVVPAFCSNHQEYLNANAAQLHVSGNLYKTACANGPGNGGGSFQGGAAAPPPPS
jgi:hypothetical protein